MEGKGTGFDPTKVGTRFVKGVSAIVVWYRWQSAEEGRRIDVRWAKDGEVVLEQWEMVERNPFAPLPVGQYQVTLVENGSRVTEIPFQIAPQ